MINLRVVDQKQIETTSRSQKVWGVLRYELLYVSWATMEVALIAPVALALLPWVRYWSVAAMTLWLLLLIIFPFNLVRLFDQLNVSYDRQRLFVALGLLLAALFSIRFLFYPPMSLSAWLSAVYANFTSSRNSLWARDMVLFAVVAFTWWRGIVLVTREPNIDRLTPQLRWGLLYLAPLAIWLASARLDWSIAPFLLLFVLAGLTAVSLTRVEQAEQEQQAYMAVATPRWLTAILLSSLLVIGVAALFAFGLNLLTVGHFSWLMIFWQPLRFTWSIIGVTFIFLTFPLADPIQRFLEWLIAYWNRLWTQLLTEAEPVEVTGQAPNTQEIIDSMEQGVYIDLVNWRVVLAVALVAVVVPAIWFMGRRYRARRLAANNGRFTRTQSQQTLSRDPSASLLDRLREGWDSWRNRGTIRTIRRIYQQMTYAAAISGFPRGEAETPYEYLPSLVQVWPDHGKDVRLITEAYVKIRYGSLPETKEEFEAILAAWRQLEETPPVTKQ